MVVTNTTLLIGTVLGQKQLTISLITTVYVTVGLAGNKENWENWKDIGSEHKVRKTGN